MTATLELPLVAVAVAPVDHPRPIWHEIPDFMPDHPWCPQPLPERGELAVNDRRYRRPHWWYLVAACPPDDEHPDGLCAEDDHGHPHHGARLAAAEQLRRTYGVGYSVVSGTEADAIDARQRALWPAALWKRRTTAKEPPR